MSRDPIRPRIHAPDQGGPAAQTGIPYVRPGPRPGVLARGLVVTGDVVADEDLIVSARVDGCIDLPDHALSIAPDGQVSGQLFARLVVVAGRVTGNVTASESIELVDGATVEGDLTAPRVGIELGATFQGKVEMRRADAAVRVARYRLERKTPPAPAS